MTIRLIRQFLAPMVTASQSAMLLALACMVTLAGDVHANATLAASKSTTATANASSIELSATEQMAHKIVTGALGPWASVQVWLTQSSEVDDGPFSGRVIANGAVHTLPALDEPESAFLIKVRSVMFRNVDQQSDNELIILYSATKIGPQQDPYYSTCVYKWNGNGFVRLADVEARLSGAKTSTDVIRRLAKVGSMK